MHALALLWFRGEWAAVPWLHPRGRSVHGGAAAPWLHPLFRVTFDKQSQLLIIVPETSILDQQTIADENNLAG
jgi:hypothetical protein